MKTRYTDSPSLWQRFCSVGIILEKENGKPSICRPCESKLNTVEREKSFCHKHQDDCQMSFKTEAERNSHEKSAHSYNRYNFFSVLFKNRIINSYVYVIKYGINCKNIKSCFQ